ncbi:MAG: hypothetical protein JSV63_02585 [Candidatus Aenigmatarchaeota archaeon]|nr:MAG: hypothetical protein JSV63_02585 [Candidatus Aenigmarchaeota archaeon]
MASISEAERAESFEDRRSRILGELSLAIDDATLDERYSCCIDPPCTMCYMGSWIWDDGICRCDEMIANGEDDKVCPQCVRGLEEGQCKYANKSICELNREVTS